MNAVIKSLTFSPTDGAVVELMILLILAKWKNFSLEASFFVTSRKVHVRLTRRRE